MKIHTTKGKIIAASLAAFVLLAVPASFAHADGLFGLPTLNEMALALAHIVLTFCLIVLYISATLLQFSIEHFVFNMKTYTDMKQVVELWALFRDIANLAFTFILLYAGISTILNMGTVQVKKVVASVIISALLVNFSFFLTGVLIDTSNMLALQFYQNYEFVGQNGQALGPNGENLNPGVGMAYIGFLRAQSLKDNPDAPQNSQSTTAWMGSLLVLVAVFVFFAAALLFIIRMIVLLLVLIFSPLAMAARILPSTKHHWTRWWNALLRNSFYAPAFLALTYLALKILSGFSSLSQLAGSDDATLASNLNNPDSDLSVVALYLLTIGLMVATLTVSRSFGAVGAATVTSWGNNARKGIQGALGRNTLGRSGAFLSRELGTSIDRLEEKGRGGRIIAATLKPIQGVYDKGANAKFGSKESYNQRVARRNKEVEEGVKKRSGNTAHQAAYIQSLGTGITIPQYEYKTGRLKGRKSAGGPILGREAKHAFSTLSAKDRALVEAEMRKAGNAGAANRLRNSLSQKDQSKMDKEAAPELAIAALNTHASEEKKPAGDRKPITQLRTEEIKDPVTGKVTSRNRVPYTVDTALKDLPVKKARELSHDARMNPDIIRGLTVGHLRDLQANGELTDEEREKVVDVITSPTGYPNQKKQQDFLNEPRTRTWWMA